MEPANRKDGRLILYTQAQVEGDTPCRREGMSWSDEKRIRALAVTFVFKMGEELKAPVAVVGTASLYLHHFYMSFSFSKFKYYEIAAATLFLALKLEDIKQDVHTIAKIAWDLHHHSNIDIQSKELKEFRIKVLDDELLLLQVIQFNLRPRLPYVQCLSIINDLSLSNGISSAVKESIAQYAWWFINASLKSTLCLTCTVSELSVACVQAALEVPSVRSQCEVKDTQWWNRFATGFDRVRYEHIADQFIESVETTEKVY